MKVDVYSITCNSIKILPYFLRHYGSFADRIFVWDDQSVDGTVEMLKSNPKVTVTPFELGRCDNFYFCQKIWPQYRQSRGFADWVICVEPDEFVYHPNILDKLEELKANEVYRVLCEGYLMYHPTLPTTKGQLYDEVKLGAIDHKTSSKTVLINPDTEIKWSIGRHHCSKERHVTRNTGIRLLHFRLLGYDYWLAKNRANLKGSSDWRHKARMRATEEDFNKMISQIPFTNIMD